MRGGGSGHSGAGDDVGSAGGSGGRSRRRPQTAAGPAPQLGPTLAGGGVDGNNRRSMVVPSGLGILGIGRLGGAGKARLGWEGDELVGMLRTSGQECESGGSFWEPGWVHPFDFVLLDVFDRRGDRKEGMEGQ